MVVRPAMTCGRARARRRHAVLTGIYRVALTLNRRIGRTALNEIGWAAAQVIVDPGITCDRTRIGRATLAVCMGMALTLLRRILSTTLTTTDIGAALVVNP